jgi:hypothetical protein
VATDTQIAGKLTTHAQQRVFERTHLTPLEVQTMLDQHHFWWVVTPVVHQKRYALVFDTVARDYLVAIVAPDVAIVKTVLTLAQFEESHHVVSDAVKLLARMTLLREDSPGTNSAGFCWRLTARGREDKNIRLPVLTEHDILEMFNIKVGRTRPEIRQSTAALFDSSPFLQWFSETLEHLNVPLRYLNSLVLDIFQHNTNRGALQLDLTGQLSDAALKQRTIRERALAEAKREERRQLHVARVLAARQKKIEERERITPRKSEEQLRRDYGMDLSYKSIVAELTHPRAPVPEGQTHAPLTGGRATSESGEGAPVAVTMKAAPASAEPVYKLPKTVEASVRPTAADEKDNEAQAPADSVNTLIGAKIPGGRGHILKTADAFALING